MFGATKTPFGGGGFGSNTSAFGAQQTTPFGGGATSGGLFGSTPAAGTFGTPAFGSTTPASGGLFGGGTSAGTSLFGNKTTQSTGFGFGNTGTSSSGGLFGGGGSSLFQTPKTSNAFGTQKQGFGFGATSNAFGASTAGSAFGTTTATGGGLFGGGGGGGTSVFGQQAQSGTTVKFQPVTSNEQTQKSGITITVKTQNQCITVMDAYKNKSIEELRLEDYAANRKGSSGSSAFGSTGATTGGLFGTSNTAGTSLFGNTAASKPAGFGGFGTIATNTTGGGLFGNTGGGLFGAKTTSSLFGGTTTTTASGFGFGGTTGGLFGNTSTAGTGLFGSSATTTQPSLFGGFGTTSSAAPTGGLFGNTSTFGQQASTGLFGTTAKPSFGFGASSGTGFGGTNTFSFNTANSGATGGLFGSTNKPAFNFAPSTGFGTATSGFGGFGNTTASTGGLFGGATSSGNLFGKPLGFGTTTGGSLFGGNTVSTGGFGTGQPTGLGGFSLSGLGVDPGMLTALRQQQVINAIGNTPFGDSALFRNLPNATSVKTNHQSPLSVSKEVIDTSQYKVLSRPAARIKPRPISSPSLGKSRLFDGLEDESDFSPHSLVPRRSVKKLIIKDKKYQDLEQPYESQLKFRSFTEDEKDNSDLVSPSPNVVKIKDVRFSDNISPEKPVISSRPIFESTISDLNARETTITPILKKTKNYIVTPLSNSGSAAGTSLDITNDTDIQPDEDTDYELPICKVVLRRPEYYTKPTVQVLDTQVNNEQCLVRDFTVGRDGYGTVRFLGVTDVYGLNLDEIVFFRRREVEIYPDDYHDKPEVGDELNKPSEITLLKVWPNDKTTHTPVKTPERLKASGFIERIEEKTIAMDAVFVDYRPREGAWVFKVNHFTRYGLQEQFIADDVAQLEHKARAKEQSIVDDIDFQRDAIKERLKKHILRRQSEEELFQSEMKKQTEDEQSEIMEDDDNMVGDKSEYQNYYDDDYDGKENIGEMEEEDFLPMSHQLGRVARVQPFHLQGMKTSVLYDDDNYTPSPRSALKNKQLFSNKSIFSSTYIEPKRSASPFPKLDVSTKGGATKAGVNSTSQNPLNASLFQPMTSEDPFERTVKLAKKSHLFKSGLVQHNTSSLEPGSVTETESENTGIPGNLYVKFRTFEMVPYDKSLMFAKTLLLSDAGLVHGREFNARWSNSLTFVHSGSKVGRSTVGTMKSNPNIFAAGNQQNQLFGFSNMDVYVEQVVMDTNEGIMQFMEECLEVSLKHTDFESKELSPLDSMTLRSGTDALDAYVEVAAAFKQIASDNDVLEFKKHSSVWELASALWGKQELVDSSTLYEAHSARRKSLSKWLSNVCMDEINDEVEEKKLQDNGHLGVIFSLLSGNQRRKACQVARDNKEYRLGFLLAQACGDQHMKHYLRTQLQQWDENNVDNFMRLDRLKLFVLLSGMMKWKSSNHLVNLCDRIDWKRCLAIHLWYYCSPSSSILDAFTEYKYAFKGTDSYEPYATFPSPDYINDEEDNNNKTKDICYHMLALYCNRPHSLEKMLTPKTHTTNFLDYHLSWHLQRVLQELGYTHLSDERHSFLQHSYASQLENMGLWHWAVYVLMHLRDSERCEYYVREILQRYCRVNEDESIDFSDEENLIVDKFHVPAEWIHEAKALHAKYMGEHYKEAVHLIRASQWDRAHSVTLEYIAADAIVEEDHETLRNLLQDISLPERLCTVKNWRTGGQVFLDYILLYQKLEDIKSENCSFSTYHLEDMEADVASLINRIIIMKVTTSRERLCQSEMARNCSNMLKVVFSEMKPLTENLMESEEDIPKWSTVKMAPYVVRLPLPPDYSLKEHRELLANYANEIEHDSPEDR